MPAALLTPLSPVASPANTIAQFAADVRQGLRKTPKQLSPKYFYDEVGSALFDVITLLPEYGLTRADERLLRRYAGDLASRLAPSLSVAELGSGSGRKTKPILQAVSERQETTTYYAIDGSASALERCRQELAGISGVEVETLECFYEEGLERIAEYRAAVHHSSAYRFVSGLANHSAGRYHINSHADSRSSSERLLVLFLGSSIGNFERNEAAAFLSYIRRSLQPGDALLLGVDLVKPVRQLLDAYDDAAGVTAAFNLNLLARINRELGANFDLHKFAHEARWCPSERRIEMHLRSLARQTVSIPGANCRVSFEQGETIWTESSYKFTTEDLAQMAARSGFRQDAQWIDEEWAFAENLWIAE